MVTSPGRHVSHPSSVTPVHMGGRLHSISCMIPSLGWPGPAERSGIRLRFTVCTGMVTAMGRIAWAVVALVVLAGCGSGEGEQAPATSSSAQARQAEAWESVPAKDREAFLAVLASIDPGLAGDDTQRQRSLRRAQDTCLDIRQGHGGDELAARVSYRYTGGQATVTIGNARKVIAAAKKLICPSL